MQDHAEHEDRPFDHRMIDKPVPLFSRVHMAAMWAGAARQQGSLAFGRPSPV
jgi:hypothetical protein